MLQPPCAVLAAPEHPLSPSVQSSYALLSVQAYRSNQLSAAGLRVQLLGTRLGRCGPSRERACAELRSLARVVNVTSSATLLSVALLTVSAYGRGNDDLATRGGAKTTSQTSRQAGTAARAKEALRLSENARQEVAEQRFDRALQSYTAVADHYADLALANYARVGRALLLYQTGQKQECVLELQGLASSLRGYAEVHAALAAVLYSEEPPALQRAELQWDIASEFDTRFADPIWVAREKHWPPAMIEALQHFLNLSQS